jgi:hypothetical protein
MTSGEPATVQERLDALDAKIEALFDVMGALGREAGYGTAARHQQRSRHMTLVWDADRSPQAP